MKSAVGQQNQHSRPILTFVRQRMYMLRLKEKYYEHEGKFESPPVLFPLYIKTETSRKSFCFACSPTAMQPSLVLPINLLTPSLSYNGGDSCAVVLVTWTDQMASKHSWLSTIWFHPPPTTHTHVFTLRSPAVVRQVRMEVHSTSNGPSITISTTRLPWHINSQAGNAGVQREVRRVVPQLLQRILSFSSDVLSTLPPVNIGKNI